MTPEQIAEVAEKVSGAFDERVRQLVALRLADHGRAAANSIALIAQRIDELEADVRELKASKSR